MNYRKNCDYFPVASAILLHLTIQFSFFTSKQFLQNLIKGRRLFSVRCNNFENKKVLIIELLSLFNCFFDLLPIFAADIYIQAT